MANIRRITGWALISLLALAPALLAGHGHGDRGYLGVGLDDLTAELQEHFGADDGLGVMVSNVDDDSPAWQAGLRVGDVITRIDGEAIEDVRDAIHVVRDLPGEAVRVEVIRDGRSQQVTAELGSESRSHRRHHYSHNGRSIVIEGDMEELEEELERLGRQMEGLGEEIGRQVERAMSEVEWDEISEAVERSLEISLRSLNNLDIEIDLEEMEESLERSLEDLEITLEELEEDWEYEVSRPAT